MRHVGENVVRIEAAALQVLADRIGGPMADAFNRAVELLYSCSGRVVVTGMGKSGIIARKIAATLNSTGTPALFMHPVEAVHGDLGMVVRGDVVVALSASGETEEILRLLATLKRLRVPLIAMTCDEIYANKAGEGARPTPAGHSTQAARSTLAEAAEVALDCSVAEEACSLGLAPHLPLACSRWEMRSQWRWRRSEALGKKILPTCILGANWEGGWHEWNLSCTLGTPCHVSRPTRRCRMSSTKCLVRSSA